jgi:hypothetical protein
MPKCLHVVAPGETVEKPKKAKTVVEAASAGTYRDLLVALQGRIAAAVQSPNCPPVALAALSRQLQLLSKELSAIDARIEDEVGKAAQVPDEVWDGAV